MTASASQDPVFHGTTIVSVRRNGQVAIGGDGQVTLGNIVVKASARKVPCRTASCQPACSR